MIKFIKNIDWYRVAEVIGFITIVAIGITLFSFAFIFGKAIVDAII